jgi:hypothetical protein
VNGNLGTTTVVVPYDMSAPALVQSLQTASGLSVNVTKSVLEPDGGREWLVTFPFTKQPVLVSTGATGLTGTGASVTVTTVQSGSALGGNFRVLFGGKASAAVPYSTSARAMQDALTTAFAGAVGEFAGLVGPEILHDLEFPEEQRLRALAPGWPQDWSPEETEIVRSMICDLGSMGWQAFRELADTAARHAEELGDA